LQAMTTTPTLLGQYLGAAASAQDSASRRAWMFYVTQKSVLLNKLDLTVLWRRNQDDRSWFTWVELRHHWRNADLALQWQRAEGKQTSEYGALSGRQSLQLVGTWFF